MVEAEVSNVSPRPSVDAVWSAVVWPGDHRADSRGRLPLNREPKRLRIHLNGTLLSGDCDVCCRVEIFDPNVEGAASAGTEVRL